MSIIRIDSTFLADRRYFGDRRIFGLIDGCLLRSEESPEGVGARMRPSGSLLALLAS